jgi:hypothetical protein
MYPRPTSAVASIRSPRPTSAASDPPRARALPRQPLLVLVVVVAVRCVTAAVVDVVDVVAMRDRHVATAIAVNMVVLCMHLVPAGGLAFVVVIIVPSMKVTVVQVVDVITVRNCNMSAAFAVDMFVIDVFVVNRLGHGFLTAVSTWLRLVSVLAHAHLTTGRCETATTPRCRGCVVCATEPVTACFSAHAHDLSRWNKLVDVNVPYLVLFDPRRPDARDAHNESVAGRRHHHRW